MIFNDNINQILQKGTVEYRNIKISKKEKTVLTRISYLLRLVENRNIVHIGFADHIELIDEKIQRDIWLHNKLIQCSKLCVGIDINTDAVEYIKKNYKIENIFRLDILNEELPPLLKNKKWDYVLLGEILEHVNSPILFLEKLRMKFKDYASSIILTVPNALRISNFQNVFRYTEKINTDHRYWFTPYTLAKILSLAGYKICFFDYCHYKNFRYGFIKEYLLRKYPPFRNNLIMVAKF